jgi:hypothetical protein
LHDFNDIREISGVDGEARLRGLRPLDEEPNGGRLDPGCRVPIVPCCRQRQGAEGNLPFRGEPQADATGDQDFQPRAVEKEFTQQRRRVDDLLEVIQHQQELQVSEGAEEPLFNWLHAHVTETEGASNRRRDQIGIGDRPKINKEDPVREIGRSMVGCSNGEAGLATPTGASQRKQANIGTGQERHDRREFVLPVNQ